MKHFIVRTMIVLSILSSAIAAGPALSAQAASAAASQPQVMPASLQDAYSATVSQPFTPSGAGYGSEHNGLSYDLSAAGLQVQGAGIGWNISLQSIGRGDSLQAVQAAAPKESGADLQYVRGSLTEWYRNLPFGLEQGFTIDQSPQGNGKLTLRLDLKSNVDGTLSKDGRGLSFASADGKTLRYDQLKAYDAAGTELDARLVYTPSTILIQVDDRNAAYPITIDPFIYLEQKVIAPDGASGDAFGRSVAVSGGTALVGAPSGNGYGGVVYVFVRSGVAWVFTAELTASDATLFDLFGASVALSGDTALIGATEANVGANTAQGAAYVFVKPASGWATTSTFTARLTASDGAADDFFGAAVALSGDTALVGAEAANSSAGAAYVFVKPGGGWATTSTFAAKLTASDGAKSDAFGSAVALSSDTAVVGASGNNSYQGAAYVFVKPGGGWTTGTETAKLTASGGQPGDYFGSSVAIDADTILVGAPAYAGGSGAGAAFVFVKPGGGWTTTSSYDASLSVLGGAGPDYFGGSVALSGGSALIGAFQESTSRGSAYVFTTSNGVWVNTDAPTARLAASDGAPGYEFGGSVAISGDAAVVGSPQARGPNNSPTGAVYFYDPYADYAISAAYNTPAASAGATVYLTASVMNFGPTYADFDLAVNAAVPAGLTYVSNSPTNGSYDAGTGVWSIGTFASGAHATLTITATVKVSPPLTIPFTASLVQSDLDNSNNSDTAILATIAASGVERLSNGGFNTYAGTSLVPTGWVAQGFGPRDGKDTHITAEGTASVRMDGLAGQTKYILQVVPSGGVAGDPLNLSFQVATRAVPATGMCLGAVLLLNGAVTVSTTFINCPTGTSNGFIPRTLRFAAPANYSAVVVVFLYAKGGGTVWIDAASLIK